jgi:phytoene synthase
VTGPRAIAEGRQRCREITRRHSKSFYFASHLLPAGAQSAAYAVYAFCRSADDAVDEAGGSVEVARTNLNAMRGRLDAIYSGTPDDPCDRALAAVVAERKIDRAPFDALLDGMEMDLAEVRLRTTAELDLYCYRAAGVVGLLMLPILGAKVAAARLPATQLGVAMQLTNILRDVGEDLGRGRIYLPEDELAKFGLSHTDIEQHRLDARWVAFMQAQIHRARDLYRQAWEGIRLIETRGGRLCARVMCLVYGDILRSIERAGYDTYRQRARTTTLRKFTLLGAALLARSTPLLPVATERQRLLPEIAGGPA